MQGDVGTRMAPSATALRTEVKEVNIFKNFTVSRKLKFDYLDWVSTLRRSKKPSPAFRKNVRRIRGCSYGQF